MIRVPFALVLALVAVGLAAAQRGSCQNSGCNGESLSGGCYCDSQCASQSPPDCCTDYATYCSSRGSGSCRSSTCDGKSATGTCWCDDQCSTQGDCCSDYGVSCGGGTAADGDVCKSCPSGPQSYQGDRRSSCYCDNECQTAGDCCPSYFDYCSDALTVSTRALFCQQLTTSQQVFCGMSLQKAFYIPMEATVVQKYADDDSDDEYDCDDYSYDVMDCSDDDDAWKTNMAETVHTTCVADPEIKGGVETCYNRGKIDGGDYNGDDTYVRFACSGTQIFQQFCEDDDECGNNSCENYPWIRVYHGGSSYQDRDFVTGDDGFQNDAWRLDTWHDKPFYYPAWVDYEEYEFIYNVPAIAGACHYQIDTIADCNGENIVKADVFMTVGVFGCLDESIESDNIWVWEGFGSFEDAEDDDESRTDFSENFYDGFHLLVYSYDYSPVPMAGPLWQVHNGRQGPPSWFVTELPNDPSNVLFYEYSYGGSNTKWYDDVGNGDDNNGKIHFTYTFHLDELMSGDYPYADAWANWRFHMDANYLYQRKSFENLYVPWMSNDNCLD